MKLYVVIRCNQLIPLEEYAGLLLVTALDVW